MKKYNSLVKTNRKIKYEKILNKDFEGDSDTGE